MPNLGATGVVQFNDSNGATSALSMPQLELKPQPTTRFLLVGCDSHPGGCAHPAYRQNHVRPPDSYACLLILPIPSQPIPRCMRSIRTRTIQGVFAMHQLPRHSVPNPEHASKAPRLSIQYRPIRELILDPKNARLHSAKQVRQIARSIQTFGFNVPILVDGNLYVIAGHGRIQACQLLGLAEVPTINLEHLGETLFLTLSWAAAQL